MHPQRKAPTTVRKPWAATILVVLFVLAIWFLQNPSAERRGSERPATDPVDASSPMSAGTAEKRDATADRSPSPDALVRSTPPASDERRTERPGAVRSSSSSKPNALREVGGGVRVSAAGLRYAPGGPEGHRLDHVLRHDTDLPDRPGVHGVFDGGPEELLSVIDEAYSLAQQSGPRVKATREGRRVIYNVNMGRRVGFVGGESGARRGHPAANHVRLVLEGENVITAFPFRP